MKRRSPRDHGFTLVEVLVALLIMAVLAGLAWQGLDGLVRARDGTRDAVERSVRLNTILSQWEQDLAALHDSPLVPALRFDGRTLRLTRSADDGVQLVAWALHGKQWQRWTGPVVRRVGDLQQSWLLSQQLQGSEPGQLHLLDGVDDWQIYFYRGNAWTNAQSSADLVAAPAAAASGATAREQLPAAVRLQIDIEGRRLTRDIALGPASP
ncbi:MAG: prepilin-type N-terminal cleavage/methylation domain-containing protein [Rubrivivax sp.]|nr:prepilin-type N-terminal cleavage/methylation domain-containing protein [Rubrivivax sp.]